MLQDCPRGEFYQSCDEAVIRRGELLVTVALKSHSAVREYVKFVDIMSMTIHTLLCHA